MKNHGDEISCLLIIWLNMKIRAFITHKLSEHYAECQDRFCINRDNHAIAVSDGMSQSVFPDYWAEILSSFYANNGHCTNEDRKELCREWLKKVVDFINSERQNGKNPWRLQNCIEAQNGAGATLCGIKFTDAENWVGHVLGDTCIIDVDIIGKAPIEILSSENKAFDSYPDYYESFPNKEGRGQIREFTGKLSKGHCLLLVSDPFSEFLYNNKEQCSQWLTRILELTGHEEYCSLVDDWRQSGLHNDDSTLCIIEPDGSMDFNIEHEDDISSLIKTEMSPKGVNANSLSPNEHPKTNIQLNEVEKADAPFGPNEQEVPTKVSQEEINQKLKREIEEFANRRCESLISNAKRGCLYPAKKKKQVARNININANEIRNFCKELVDKCKECIDKSLRILIEE